MFVHFVHIGKCFTARGAGICLLLLATLSFCGLIWFGLVNRKRTERSEESVIRTSAAYVRYLLARNVEHSQRRQ